MVPAGLFTLITVGKTWFLGFSMNFLSKLAYFNSADLGGLAGGMLLVMLLDVELPVLCPLVVLRFEDCFCCFIIVGLAPGWAPFWSIHSPCCLGKLAFTPAFTVLLLCPDEDEEERREEIGGFVEEGCSDILVVAGITAGCSLSRAASLLLGLLRTWSSRSTCFGIFVVSVILSKTPNGGGLGKNE